MYDFDFSKFGDHFLSVLFKSSVYPTSSIFAVISKLFFLDLYSIYFNNLLLEELENKTDHANCS